MQATPPIAAFGFWADRSVPLGNMPADHDDIVTVRGNAAKARGRGAALTSTAVTPSKAENTKHDSLADDKERRTICAAVKERAEVGDAIRWSVILEATAGIPCAFDFKAKAEEKDKDDQCSTTASVEASDSVATSSEDEARTLMPRGVRAGRVYPATLLLRVFQLCQGAERRPPGAAGLKAVPRDLLGAQQGSEPAAAPSGLEAPPGLAAPTAAPSARAPPWRAQEGARKATSGRQERAAPAPEKLLRNAPWRSREAAPRLAPPPGL